MAMPSQDAAMESLIETLWFAEINLQAATRQLKAAKKAMKAGRKASKRDVRKRIRKAQGFAAEVETGLTAARIAAMRIRERGLPAFADEQPADAHTHEQPSSRDPPQRAASSRDPP